VVAGPPADAVVVPDGGVGGRVVATAAAVVVVDAVSGSTVDEQAIATPANAATPIVRRVRTVAPYAIAVSPRGLLLRRPPTGRHARPWPASDSATVRSRVISISTLGSTTSVAASAITIISAVSRP
jgi:hypothetical protein